MGLAMSRRHLSDITLMGIAVTDRAVHCELHGFLLINRNEIEVL